MSNKSAFDSLAEQLSDRLVARVHELTRDKLGLKGTHLKVTKKETPIAATAGAAPAPKQVRAKPTGTQTDKVRQFYAKSGAKGALNETVVNGTGLEKDQVQKLIHSLYTRGELKRIKKGHYARALAVRVPRVTQVPPFSDRVCYHGRGLKRTPGPPESEESPSQRSP